MPAQPLLAFWHECESEGAMVLFARSEAGARSLVARRRGLHLDETEVQRCACFDKYADRTGGTVTDGQRLAEGWPAFCMDCQHLLGPDGCDDCPDEGGERPAWVEDGDFAYCSEACRQSRLARLARLEARKVAALAAVRERLPFVRAVHAWNCGLGSCAAGCWGRDPENVVVYFAVPGGPLSERTADGNMTHNAFCHGCGGVWVARGDLDAFRALRDAAPSHVVTVPAGA